MAADARMAARRSQPRPAPVETVGRRVASLRTRGPALAVSGIKDPGLRTLLVAAVTLALVVVGGFAVQAATLGRPGPGPLLAVRAVAQLNRYLGSSARITLDGRTVRVGCSERWIRQRRWTTVTRAGRPWVIEIGNQLLQTDRAEVVAFELAGCPRPLRKWLATQINTGSRVELRRARVGGRPVYRIRFLDAKLKLVLYVTRSDALPVALALRTQGVAGTSLLRYLDPAVSAP